MVEELPARAGLPGLGTIGRRRVHDPQPLPRPEQAEPVKSEPYECGLPSDVQRGFRFGISFYLIAMLFILFDVEVIFLYPGRGAPEGRGRLRAQRDPDVRRAAGGGLRLRVAPRSARME